MIRNIIRLKRTTMRTASLRSSAMWFKLEMRKALGETQTLRAGALVRRSQKCSPPPHIPFPGAQEGQNLTSWRGSLPSPTDTVWWRLMHAILSYRSNRPTKPQTHKQTDRQDRLQYTAPLASAQCNNISRCRTDSIKISQSRATTLIQHVINHRTVIGWEWLTRSAVNNIEARTYYLANFAHFPMFAFWRAVPLVSCSFCDLFAVVTTTIRLRFDCVRSTPIFDFNLTALRPFDDTCYDRRHCIVKK